VNFPPLFVASLLLGCLWAVLCRLAALHPSRATLVVALQHMALGLGICGGLLLPTENAAHASLAIGVTVFLLMGAPRWRHRAPGGLGLIERGKDR